ncbi:MAG: APC family permease [Chloroflexaceae bacterium]|nr:APC family permease [Chloroflexaceae bacterium]
MKKKQTRDVHISFQEENTPQEEVVYTGEPPDPKPWEGNRKAAPGPPEPATGTEPPSTPETDPHASESEKGRDFAILSDETTVADITLVCEDHDSCQCPLNQVIMTEESGPGRIHRLLFGRPLREEEIPRRKMSKRIGLAAFASDAFASVAYASQEILQILILAGTAALSLSVPIAGAICVLLVIVMLSYRQMMFIYPDGGGAYIAARDNLGERAAQVAGAALLVDYVLTVAVSVSSGVEHIASAFPYLLPYRVVLCVSIILLMTLTNLRGVRGVRETDYFFPLPIFIFLLMMFLMIGTGFWHWFHGTLPRVEGGAVQVQATQPLTLFLILRAFSSGAIALTGMEAISNRIKVFKEPRSQNAATVILMMSGLLMMMFMGITLLSQATHAVPLPNETIVSQLARTIFTHEVPYYLMIAATVSVLIMAANTSFGGFPRLAALQASEGFLPRWLSLRGYRLSFSWGIGVLAVGAALLIVAFQASTTALIPLYAIGVFLSFTLAQAGMVVHWRRVSRRPQDDQPAHSEATGGTNRGATARKPAQRYDPNWKAKLVLNALGCGVTAIVTLVFVSTKLSHGAWVALLAIAVLVWLFLHIHHHYQTIARSLSLEHYQPEPDIEESRHTVVILVSGVHRGTLVAARYARSIQAQKLIAVHVETDPSKTEKVHERWTRWMPDIPLMVVSSPYRTLVKPLVNYVNMLACEESTDLVTIVIPQFVCVRWWHRLLHNQTVLMIRSAFLFDRDKVVIEVPFRLEE